MQAVPGVLAIDLARMELDAKPEPRAIAPTHGPIARQPAGAAPTGPLDWARVPTLTGTPGSVPPTEVLVARPARQTNTGIQPAELLLINPLGITLTQVAT
jgi:hypothetical protein